MKADDLDSVTDPSKLSESDFAPGTKWTSAGWTRSNPQYVANSSNIQLMKEDTHKLSPQNNTLPIQTTDLLGLQGSWSIKADDLSTSHKILLSSIQFSDNYDNNNIAKNRIDYLLRNNNSTRITYKDDYIGDLIIEGKDNREVDIWFKPAMNNENNGVKKYAGNISFSMYLPRFIWLNYVKRVYVDQLAQLKQKDFKQYLIFNNKIYKRTYTPQVSWTPAPTPNMSYNNNFNIDPVYSLTTFLHYSVNPFLLDNNNKYMSFDAKPNNRTFIRVLKINGKNFDNNNVGDIYTDVYVPIYNANNQVMHSGQDNTNVYNYAHIEGMPLKNITQNKLSNNLSAYDLINQAKMNSVSYSTQSDGSMLLGIKINYEGLALPEDIIRDYLSHIAYYPNIDDPTHKQQIIDNTMKHLHDKKDQPDYIVGLQEYLGMLNNIDPAYWTATDVTPLNLEWNGEVAPMSSGFKDTNSSSANAELYRTAVVHYLDSKTGNNISNDSIMGTKNNSTDYKLNIPKGYILDTKSGKNVDGKQYKWSTDKKSIAYTFNEDQKVNDANPINIYITHGTHNTNDNSGKSTRTIQYTGLPDNLKPKDKVQTVLFKRSGVTDDVSGETTYGDWQPQSGNGHYTAVPSPAFAGYRPDQAVIPDTAATPNKNENVTVNYSRTNQNAKLTVHDDTANTDLNDYAENSTGLYQDQINFKTAPSEVEQELKDKGYNVVSDNFKDSPTYNADDSKNNFVIHVTHKIVPVTPDQPKKPTDVIPDTKQHYPTGVDTNDLNQSQQRQITYTYADSKKQASSTITQKAAFHRTATVDNVTGKTTYTDWTTSDQYPEVKSPSIEGYTPDKSNVPVTKPVLNTKQDVAVVYNPDPEQVDVIAQDNTGKQLSKSTLHGNYNTDYSATTPVIKGYHLIKMPTNAHGTYKIHNDPIIYIYAPDSNSVPEQPDGTPKPDKSSYPDDLTPAKRSNKLPETGSINLQSEINSVTNNIIHTLSHLLH